MSTLNHLLDANGARRPNICTQDEIASVCNRAYLGFRRFKDHQSPLFDGPPGCNKSGGVLEWHQSSLASRPGAEFWDVRLGNWLPSDVGLPVPDMTEQVAKKFLTNELPFHRDPTSSHTVFLDEMGGVTGPMQKVILRLIQDREIDGQPLPDDTFIIGAMNGSLTRSHTERLGWAQHDRFARWFVDPVLMGLRNHLRKSGQFAELDAFLEINPNLAYNFDIKKWDGETGTPTFRSIHNVGKYLATFKNDVGEFVSDPLSDPMFKGHVASKAGPEFAEAMHAFLVIFNSVGSIDDVINNPDTFAVPADPATKWVVATKLVSAADSQNFGNVIKAAHRLAPGKPGFVEMFVGHSATNLKKGLRSSPAVIQWMSRPEIVAAACGRA